MIRPTKNMDLDLCVLNCAASIIEELSGEAAVKYDALAERLIGEHGDQARFQLPHALSFLFLLGTVEYFPEADSLRLTSASK